MAPHLAEIDSFIQGGILFLAFLGKFKIDSLPNRERKR